MDQNHLGKFLKLNSLEYPLIEYQLFNFSKESLKQILLSSKCGEIINGKEFKNRPPTTDLLNTKHIYPLACLYKKAKPKIKSENNIYHWKQEKIKKNIDILSNAYMTLSILNLAEYYDKIIYNEKKRNDIVKFYVSCAKYQLNYYLNNFRNELGLFVNKITLDDNKNKDHNITFSSSDSSFEFSAQAYLMVCFYKCSVFLKDTSPYKLPFLNFSKEIENMFIEFKNDILNYPNKKSIELLQALILYINVDNCTNTAIISLSLDIVENFFSKYSLSSISTYNKFLLYNVLIELKSSVLKQNNDAFSEQKKLISEYIWDLDEIFLDKNLCKNEIIDTYDIIAYELYLLKFNKHESLKFYNDVLIPSKIFSSFPNIPKNYESEKYFQFNYKAENIIPDKYFKPSLYKTMNECNLTPIVCKNIHFLQDKHKFSKPKVKFDSRINMRLIYLMISTLKNIIIKATK